MSKFDLMSLDTESACDKGAEIELVHPITKKPTGVVWGIVGRDSKIFQNAVRAQIDEDTRRAAMARKRGKDPEILTTEQKEARGIALLAACSTHWKFIERNEQTGEVISERNTLPLEGRELEFTQANVLIVLKKLSAAREQIDEGIADLENFMKV
jgi:hypothetical protein